MTVATKQVFLLVTISVASFHAVSSAQIPIPTSFEQDVQFDESTIAKPKPSSSWTLVRHIYNTLWKRGSAAENRETQEQEVEDEEAGSCSSASNPDESSSCFGDTNLIIGDDNNNGYGNFKAHDEFFQIGLSNQLQSKRLAIPMSEL